jgi:hypothetical protein
MLTYRNLEVLRDRYPTAEERDYLTSYSESLGRRILAHDDLIKIKSDVIDDTMRTMIKMYPNIPRFHVNGFDRGYRDNTLLLEYMAKSMLLDDVELYNDQVLTWVRTLFKSFNFTPKFMRDNFTYMRDAVRNRGHARTFELMAPLLTHTINYLSDIPEPVRPEV